MYKECEFYIWNDTITIDDKEIDLTPSPGAEYYETMISVVDYIQKLGKMMSIINIVATSSGLIIRIKSQPN